MSIKPKTCVYFRRDGCCVKGDYCEFSHQISNSVCKNFINGFCKFGDSCNFQHSKGSKVSLSNVPIISNKNNAIATSTSTVTTSYQSDSSTHNTTITTDNDTLNFHSFETELERLWGLEHDDKELNKVKQLGISQSSQSYAKATASNITFKEREDMNLKSNRDNTNMNTHNKEHKELCKFYMTGNCRFGIACKNRHDDSVSPDIATSNDDMKPECGICMSIPTKGVYGILNNCNCIFCLECVREWRRDGKSVTKSTEQVRLCPLCRRQSHFVVPSTKSLSGDEKELLVQTYKEIMSSKPCKVRLVY